MTPKIYVKSMKNQGYVADAFLERFGAALGCQMLDLGSQNVQNITKTATKIDPKSMKNRGCVFGAFLEGVWATQGGPSIYFWEPFGDHFRSKIEKMTSKKASKNRCRKSIEK